MLSKKIKRERSLNWQHRFVAVLVLTLLYLTQNRNIHFKKIEYRNSGDSMPYGDREEVVDTWRWLIRNGSASPISPEKQKELLKKGHNALEQYLKTGKSVISQSSESDEIFVPHTGVFVSTYVRGEFAWMYWQF